MRKIILSGLNGLGFGSFVFLFFIAMNQSLDVSSREILSVWIMSGLIGMTKAIISRLNLPILVDMGSHFLITLLLVMITFSYNHWIQSGMGWLTLTIEVIIIYIIIVIIVAFRQRKSVDQINQLIQKRNQKH